MYSYSELKKKIEILGKIIDAPSRLFPELGQKDQFAKPYIEIKFPFYYLVISENGRELDRQKFLHTDMLLYAVFEKITFEMSLQYEVAHRVPSQDFRRVLFSHQLELMEKLSPEWREQRQNRIIDILNRHPYQDNV